MAKILIVDDEKNICEEFKEVLEEEGHQVDTARNGEEAILRVEQNDYDLVFLDVLMPRMEGRQVFEEIRKIKPIPVVIMSGYLPANKEKDVLAMGAAGCMKKPFHISHVRKIIQSIEAKKA